MKIVVQRVHCASVEVEGKVFSSIEKGLCLLVCLEKSDSQVQIQKAAEKVLKLRIFPDQNGYMNLSVLDCSLSILAVSQFTLAWEGTKGNRPSFDNSMEPIQAKEYFEKFCEILRAQIKLETGCFGADMNVHLCNWGPVTFSLKF